MMQLRVPATVAWEVVDGEAFVFNSSSGSYHSLSPSGTRMWELLAEFGSTGDVLERMKVEYDGADSTSIESDLEAFVGDLVQRGLLESEEVE